MKYNEAIHHCDRGWELQIRPLWQHPELYDPSRTSNIFVIDLNSGHLHLTISIAFSGQTILQLSHLVQIAWSISCFSYGLKGIALTGHSCEHLVQPVQLSVTIYFIRSRHFFAGHIPFVCISYSSLKYLSPVRTGLGAVFPSPHRLPFLTDLLECLKFFNIGKCGFSFTQPCNYIQHVFGANPAEGAFSA